MTSSFSTTRGLVAVPGTGFKFPEARSEMSGVGGRGEKARAAGSQLAGAAAGITESTLLAADLQHQNR